jgi:hypothetical protein
MGNIYKVLTAVLAVIVVVAPTAMGARVAPLSAATASLGVRSPVSLVAHEGGETSTDQTTTEAAAVATDGELDAEV